MPDDLAKALLDYADLVTASQMPTVVTGGTHPFVVVPQNFKMATLESLLYNDYAARPHRVKQDVTLANPLSFISYWRVFNNENSRIFADPAAQTITAVFDYHEPLDKPRWGSHTACLVLRHTIEWKTWTELNNINMSHSQMALFLEDNAPDVRPAEETTGPSAATMTEVARTLQATESSSFESKVNHSNGAMTFAYRNDIAATAGGDMKVPERFNIHIAVFEGMPFVDIEVRFRYRIQQQRLTMWYSLLRPHVAERDAFESVVAELSEDCREIFIGHS